MWACHERETEAGSVHWLHPADEWRGNLLTNLLCRLPRQCLLATVHHITQVGPDTFLALPRVQLANCRFLQAVKRF